MTWGSNATGCRLTCRYCGEDCVDDIDEGPFCSHELACPERSLVRRIKRFFGISNLPKAEVIVSRKGID